MAKRSGAQVIALGLALAIVTTTAGCHRPQGGLLSDTFAGPVVDAGLWRQPLRESAGDGTFVGRTRFRTAGDSPLPTIESGRLVLPLRSFNAADPAERSFWGSELISRRSFTVDEGLDLFVRAKFDHRGNPGLVAGIFLYALKPGSVTLHDEIDFELLSNLPDRAQTNIYGNEELGVGHTELIPYRSGSIADIHDYEIRWTRDSVTWLIDGQVVRTTGNLVPAGPMEFYLNVWAPDAAWAKAYSPLVEPATAPKDDRVLGALIVEQVTIKPLRR